MTSVGSDARERLASTLRIADMMCSAHANLRDRFAKRALLLDCILLVSSTVVAAHTFGAERIGSAISFLSLPYDFWLAVFGLLVFVGSILQLRVSWKETSGAHARSFAVFTEVKHDLGRLLSADSLDADAAEDVLARYALAGEVGTTIPEPEFLKQKQKHKLKVFVSQYLDTHPGASVTLVKLKVFCRDNFGWNVLTK